MKVVWKIMFKNVIKGAVIGVANVIPGISGGTLALILGIYERLTESIGEFFNVPHKKKLEYGIFLCQILLGAGIGIILFSRLIEYLFKNYYEGTSFFFMGLIIASLPTIIEHKKRVKPKKKEVVLFILGGMLPLVLFFYQDLINTSSFEGVGGNISNFYMIKLFVCGIIAGGTMVIPGISGSLILMILGEYYNVLGFINNFKIFPMFIFSIGAGAGIFIFAKVMDKFLKRYKDETLYFILGIVTISLLEMWPDTNFSRFSILEIIMFIVVFFAGFFVVSKAKNIKLER
jgi:putative membrane protein